MTKEAVVVNTPNGLMAQIKRQEACLTCRACDFGRSEEINYPLPEGNYKEGDSVIITLPDRRLAAASVLAYGIPLALMIAGMFLGSLVSDNELIQAFLAVSFGGVGVLYLFLSEKKRRKTQRFKCAVSSSSGNQRKLS